MRKLRWYHPALALWVVIVVLDAPGIMGASGVYGLIGYTVGVFCVIIVGFWVLSKIYGAIVWVLSKIYGVIVGKGKKGEQK